MGASIYTIPLGVCNTYIVKDQGTIMIDSGEPKKGKAFLNGLNAISIAPEEIQVVIMTHGHYDHIGSAAEIKKITNAKIALHKNEKQWLEEGLKPFPPGVNTYAKILAFMTRFTWVPFIHIEPTKVDIALNDDELDLKKYGISGKIVYTPGHTSGSVSITLDSGDAFVGDLVMNMIPLRFSPGPAIWAEDQKLLLESCQMLLDKGIKTMYPSHGKPFPVDKIRTELANLLN